jgi:hypothetical protein
VWKEQNEHQILNKNTGKINYTKPSFIADDTAKKLAYDNRKVKATGFKQATSLKERKQRVKKEVPKKERTCRNNNSIAPLSEVPTSIVEAPLNVVPTPIVNVNPENENIRPLEEIKEDIPLYNENQEITDFIARVHASEPTFPVGEYDNEHPCIVLKTEFLNVVPTNEVSLR